MMQFLTRMVVPLKKIVVKRIIDEIILMNPIAQFGIEQTGAIIADLYKVHPR